MRLAALAALLLGGCASFSGFQPATPDGYDGPTVNVADTAVLVNADLAQVFELTHVDGRRLLSTSIATVQAHQGRGFTSTPVALTNELPPRPARVRLQGVTQYARPMLALSQPNCRVAGEVAFTPEAGRRYAVNGHIGAVSCEVWIEDLATRQPATAKLSSKGTGS